MRDYKQLTREVFLKSEEKLKKRRRERSIILSSCASLCLLAVVGTSAYFNAPTKLDITGGTGNVEPYFSAQIECGENVMSIGNPDDAISLYNAISTLCDEQKDGGTFGQYDANDTYLSKGDQYDLFMGGTPFDPELKYQENLSEKGVTITFISDKKVVDTFVLKGNNLIDINEQKEVHLTKVELLKLKQILQIKEE